MRTGAVGGMVAVTMQQLQDKQRGPGLFRRGLTYGLTFWLAGLLLFLGVIVVAILVHAIT